MLRNNIIKLLKEKDMKLEEMAEKLDMGKLKLSKILKTLVNKKIIKEIGDKYHLPIEVKKEIDEVPKPPKKLGLSEQIDELNDKLELLTNIRKKHEKRYALRGLNIKRLKRYNKGKTRGIFMLRQNGGCELVKGTFMQGMVKVGENYYDGSAMFVWMFKAVNKLTPIYIIPEWSTRPLCREEVYQRAVKDKTLIDSQIITLRAMKMEQTEKGAKKRIGGMGWIGIIIGAVVLIWLFLGGSK